MGIIKSGKLNFMILFGTGRDKIIIYQILHSQSSKMMADRDEFISASLVTSLVHLKRF